MRKLVGCTGGSLTPAVALHITQKVGGASACTTMAVKSRV